MAMVYKFICIIDSNNGHTSLHHTFLSGTIMIIGVYKISIVIPDNLSLKGKRSIIKSIMQRLKNQFNIAIAEVDNNDSWQIATLGLSCVSNDFRHVETMLANIKNFFEETANQFQLIDEFKKIITINP